MQEFRTGATRQNMETVHSKEDAKRLKGQLGDLRSKVADLESKVGVFEYCIAVNLVLTPSQVLRLLTHDHDSYM